MVIYDDCNNYLPTIATESIDLIVTDPPYGIDYQSNRQEYSGKCKVRNAKYFDKIIGDKDLPTDWLKEAYRILKPGTAIYIFCHWSKWCELSNAVQSSGFKIKNMLVLNKSNHGMGDLKGDYAPKHELLLFATKGRHILNYDRRPNSVLDVSVLFSKSIRPHPNSKPTKWYEIPIKYSSDIGDLILDPFAGTGTLAEACINLKRNYILIEKDEKYIPIIKDRISKLRS